MTEWPTFIDRKMALVAYECVTRVASSKLGWPAHALLEVTNIMFSTCTNIHRTELS